uniref:Peptidase_S9 domain-containing protein n=1 Tax=Syphacia muris TaxID=451379 RepID=A0A158R5K4_9BILA
MTITILVVLTILQCTIAAELIPRELLFSNPQYSGVSLSPDGQTIGYLALDSNGIRNVFTKCVTCKYTQIATFEKTDIADFYWTAIPNIIIFSQDNDGDENHRLYKLNITRANPRNKPIPISERIGVKAVLLGNNVRDTKIVVALNDEVPQFHNVYEFNLLTNEMTMIMHNNRFPLTMSLDNDLNIRLVAAENDDGSITFYSPSEKANKRMLTSNMDDWDVYLTVSSEDKVITSPIAFTADNERIYWQWGANSDLGSLVIHDFGKPENNEVLYTATRGQIGSVFLHPIDKTIMALNEIYHKPEIFIANETVLDDFQYLVNLRPNDPPIIIGVSSDFHTWLVTFLSDKSPFEIFLYRRWQKKAEYLFTTRPELQGKQLNKMIGFDFSARDNMKIQAYLSLPPEAKLRKATDVDEADALYANLGMLPVEPQKLIISVHGGPRSRDVFGFTSENAWLTNRGYAVLQVNFRGSTGFGKKYTDAGNGEWGRKMHYDLIDAVDFVVAKGIANRSQIAIMGASYGGYATLIGMTFTPDVFACGVDIFGPSNLLTLLETMPPYWQGFYKEMTTMLGADKNNVSGKLFSGLKLCTILSEKDFVVRRGKRIVSLKSRSPLFFAKQVRKPLIILQGANDPRVRQSESDQFVDELKKHKIPVTYVLYPNEGHGFGRQENSLSRAGYIEQFLHKCLGGEYEPFVRGQYNSSAIVRFHSFM